MNLLKYHRLIVVTENADWFRKWVTDEKVRRVFTLAASVDKCIPTLLGSFNADRFQFSCRHFAVTYNVSSDIPIDKNWHTMRHISQRNQITARLLEMVIRLQYKYLQTYDPMDLCRLPYKQIENEYKRQYNGNYMDSSIISRVVRNKMVCISGYKEMLLTDLFPGDSYLIGRKIIQLLKTGNPLLSDRDLQGLLIQRYGLQLTRRYVTYCRNLMDIPVARLRREKTTGIFSDGFSYPKSFELNALSTIPKVSGVYLLSLNTQPHTYVNNRSYIVYIGSSKNINQRSLRYLNGYAHTEKLKQFMNARPLQICYYQTSDYKKLEASLIHNFVDIYGSLPLLNQNKPSLAKGN